MEPWPFVPLAPLVLFVPFRLAPLGELVSSADRMKGMRRSSTAFRSWWWSFSEKMVERVLESHGNLHLGLHPRDLTRTRT